jgi:hypothetical protein
MPRPGFDFTAPACRSWFDRTCAATAFLIVAMVCVWRLWQRLEPPAGP